MEKSGSLAPPESPSSYVLHSQTLFILPLNGNSEFLTIWLSVLKPTAPCLLYRHGRAAKDQQDALGLNYAKAEKEMLCGGEEQGEDG